MRRRIALSQNFLVSPRLVDALLDRSTVGADDIVYEIGPGRGIITERLANRCRHVIAVEKDPRLAERLGRRLAGRSNVSLYLSDFLAFPLPITPYKVFANLPFNVTAAVVSRLASAPTPPSDSYLVVQREAAGRFLGLPRGRAESLTSVLLKPWFEPTVIHDFQRTDFTPAPGVDVVVLRLRKRGPPLVAAAEAQRYRDFVTACFAAWQPTVGRAMAGFLDHEQRRRLSTALPARSSLARTWASRPSEVPFDAWLQLFRGFARVADASTWKRLAGAEERLRRQQARLQKVHRTRVSRVRPPPTVCPTVGAHDHADHWPCCSWPDEAHRAAARCVTTADGPRQSTPLQPASRRPAARQWLTGRTSDY